MQLYPQRNIKAKWYTNIDYFNLKSYGNLIIFIINIGYLLFPGHVFSIIPNVGCNIVWSKVAWWTLNYTLIDWQVNALKAISPATVDVLLKVIQSTYQPRRSESAQDVLSLKELVMQCIVCVVHIISRAVPEEVSFHLLSSTTLLSIYWRAF